MFPTYTVDRFRPFMTEYMYAIGHLRSTLCCPTRRGQLVFSPREHKHVYSMFFNSMVMMKHGDRGLRHAENTRFGRPVGKCGRVFRAALSPNRFLYV